jgi:hypothetical protein
MPPFNRRPRGRRRSSSFSPLSIANIIFWYDPVNATCWNGSSYVPPSDGLSCAWINDASPNAHTLSEATNWPTWRADAGNGKPGVEFDGTNDKLKTVDFSLSQPLTVFAVVKQLAWTDNDYIYDFDNDTSTGPRIYQNSSSPNVYMHAGSEVGARSLALNTIGLFTHVFNGASSSAAINDSSTSTSAGTQSIDGFTVGCNGASALFANFTLLDIIAYNSALTFSTNDDGWKVRQYLYTKHGITP